jgi:hypothetical protein
VTVYDGDPNDGGTALGCTGAGDGVLNQLQPDVATCTTSSLAVGVHQIYARYPGDITFLASTNSYHRTVTVSKAGTALTLGLSTTSAVLGQTVAFTATLMVNAPGSGTPGGTVTFSDGNPSSGGTAISCSGSGDGTLNQQQPDIATCTTSSLALGTHQIYATYTGGSGFAASTYIRSLVVRNASTGALVTAFNYNLVVVQTATFTAAISARSPPVWAHRQAA